MRQDLDILTEGISKPNTCVNSEIFAILAFIAP